MEALYLPPSSAPSPPLRPTRKLPPINQLPPPSLPLQPHRMSGPCWPAGPSCCPRPAEGRVIAQVRSPKSPRGGGGRSSQCYENLSQGGGGGGSSHKCRVPTHERVGGKAGHQLCCTPSAGEGEGPRGGSTNASTGVVGPHMWGIAPTPPLLPLPGCSPHRQAPPPTPATHQVLQIGVGLTQPAAACRPPHAATACRRFASAL